MAEIVLKAYSHIKNNKAIVDGEVVFSCEKPFDNFIQELYRDLKLDYPKISKMDNQSKLGLLGAELLLKKMNLSARYTPQEIALVLSNSSSSLETDRGYYETASNKDNYFPSPALFVYTLSNIVAGEISIKNKIKGETAFFVSEKFNSNLIEFHILNLFESTFTKACIGGWINYEAGSYDAFLFLAEFASEKNEPSLNSKLLNQLYNN